MFTVKTVSNTAKEFFKQRDNWLDAFVYACSIIQAVPKETIHGIEIWDGQGHLASIYQLGEWKHLNGNSLPHQL